MVPDSHVRAFNGGGFTDILTGAGPTGGPHLRVFNALNLQELDSFYALNPDFSSGIFVG